MLKLGVYPSMELTIISDYDAGFRPAVRNAIPYAKHQGCYFHFCQAVDRNLGPLTVGIAVIAILGGSAESLA